MFCLLRAARSNKDTPRKGGRGNKSEQSRTLGDFHHLKVAESLPPLVAACRALGGAPRQLCGALR